MTDPNRPVVLDGEVLLLTEANAIWHVSWHSPGQRPLGEGQGSEGVCELCSGNVVLVRNVGGRIDLPGGHPEPGETSEQTLVREVAEEACARVLSAVLIGYCRSECIEGDERGKVIVRDMWHARVELNPWIKPENEIAERIVVPSDQVVQTWSSSWPGLDRLIARIMSEAQRSAIPLPAARERRR